MLSELGEWASNLGGAWSKAFVIGSGLLYVVGYLTIRFHLTAIGIGTDLSVLDERYLFAGARFFVYLVSSIPSLVLVALPVLLLVWVLSRLFPRTLRARFHAAVRKPRLLLVLGILFAVGMIQLVMRQCFFLVNLLLAEVSPDAPSWLVFLLVHEQWMPLYFGLLVVACGLSLLIVWVLRAAPFPPGLWTAARLLFFGLVAVQILLLPINYGVLIVDKVMPRVASLGATPLSAGERAWLVWEGRDGSTFLVQGRQLQASAPAPRRLVTLARADVKRLDILDFDSIMPTLFGAKR